MNDSVSRRILFVYLLLLVPVAWLSSRFSPYQIDGDAVAYMDIADLLHAHHWAGAVNAYWHPLYPACLALAQMVLHPTRMNELGAYYILNFAIFLAQNVAMLFFVTALYKLRTRMQIDEEPLLSLDMLRLLGVCLLVTASQREFSMGQVRTDALLMTLMLAAFASMLEILAGESLFFAPLTGLFLGLAYLTKSFAFLVALLSIGVLMLFQAWIQRRPLYRVVASGGLTLAVFAAVAGPYMAALSRQKHRLDFGDSGALAYAWYSSGTEKMHLEPWQTDRFGSASVHLIHPEIQLLGDPGIYSYRAEPYGTYPAWFDPTYFNERIVPHLNLHILVPRVARNLVLVIRYLLNHPELCILLFLLLAIGARFGFTRWRHEAFWAPMIVLGLAMWGLYGLIVIEERYVTLAYVLTMLPVFAALCVPAAETAAGDVTRAPWMRQAATPLVVLIAFLALMESVRIAGEGRRKAIAEGLPHPWYSKEIFGAATGLRAIGVKPGDEIACMGTIACLNTHYWARLAEVRVLTEVDNPSPKNLFAEFEELPNRQQVYDVVKAQGAKAMVAYFWPGEIPQKTPALRGWVRLGLTDFYAIPLNLPRPASATPLRSTILSPP